MSEEVDFKQVAAAFRESQEAIERKPDPLKAIATRAAVDMDKYRDIPAWKARDLLPARVWGNILREGTLAIVGGESKARKSWFGLSLGLAAVTGWDFLGERIHPPEEGHRRVLLLDFELLEENLMSRFIGLTEGFEEDEAGLNAIWSRIELRCHRGSLDEEAPWLGYLSHAIDSAARGDLVIIDCLQALPLNDHNSVSEVRAFLGRLQAAATRSGACVLVVDHFSKSTEARGKNRISGSVAKAATPDAVMILESAGDGLIKFSCDLRMDAPRDPITLEFESSSVGFRVVDDGEVEIRRDASKAKKEAEIADERRRTLFPAPHTWASKAELAERAGVTPKTVVAWLTGLEEIEVDASEKTHRYQWSPK